MYDPVYNRGKAKKFAYKYKGPDEVKQRISPLVYRVRTKEGTDVIVHVNRLKRAYGQNLPLMEGPPVPPKKNTSRMRKRQVLDKIAPVQVPDEIEEEVSASEAKGKQLIEEGDRINPNDPTQMNSPSSSPEPNTADSWTPGSRYL